MNASVESRDFGVLPTGEPVQAWTICGSGGLKVEAITYGGIIRTILVPDCHGEVKDVVLGFSTLADYVAGHPYFGAMIGRVAGRINGARFDHNKETFRLSMNDGPNHLHGGFQGFDRKLWVARPAQRSDGAPSVVMTAASPDGEEGYPGAVTVSVTYTVLADNTLLIETEATSDRPTPLNLTHHSYFNLSGEGSNPVTDHTIQIMADQYVPIDERLALLGFLKNVAGTSEDLRQPMKFGYALVKLVGRHGSLYKIRRPSGEASNSTLVHAARMVHPGSGRALDVFSTEPYLQLYTGASLDGSLLGKSGIRYGPHQGVCLECEGYPDGANTPELGNIVMPAGVPRRSRTAYSFSVLPLSMPAGYLP